MKRPPLLHRGDAIALVAPSFGCTTEPYITRLGVATERWRKKGFEVVAGPNVFREDGISASASPQERAKEIMDALQSNASLVLSVGGGELMNEMMPELDFASIAKLPPKWFMGFSDNTNLTFFLTLHCGWETIYGPCAGAFFQKQWRLCEADAFALLQGQTHFEGYPKYSITRSNPDRPLAAYRCTQPKVITPHLYEKPFEGTLMGGCLDVLILHCGTKLDRVKAFNQEHPEGIIWYLEACDLNPLALRRAYFQLRQAGWFDNAVGFILGRPKSAMEPLLGVDRFNAAIDILGPLGKPILIDVDLGHISPSMPIRNGAKARVAYENENLIIDYLEA
ncbi:MAG: LD-carboxypeptidase [Bacilli bacterium]|nr:LD-carboxypeptidase [Bacilli bacterium]